jgi:RNA polymerase primary sigma factor
MPAQKSVKPVQSASKSDPKAKSVPASKTPVVKSKAQQLQEAADALLAAGTSTKKKPGRPPKTATEDSDTPVKTGAKRGRKPKGTAEPAVADDMDLSDIEADLVGEPATVTTATGEKVKPLRMKISKAKERALMKEFGLDETVLSEEDIAKRRQRLKALITLGKTRGYLTHGEISDHLPDKLVDAETLEVVISMLNDMGVAVYEQTPDAETLLLNNNVSTAATPEEAEEEAEAALSTVDSEFGRTTDPVRMYMREMGTVELLTREGRNRDRQAH